MTGAVIGKVTKGKKKGWFLKRKPIPLKKIN